MRVLGVVPARGGSTRVRGKNLRPLGGIPLVARSIEAALAAATLDTVALSSDDPAILDIGRAYDIEVIERPNELAADTSLAIEYVQHAVSTFADQAVTPFDAVAIIQPSSPLTESSDIDATVSVLDTSGAESVVSVMKVDHAIHPVKLKTLDGDRLVPFFEEEAGRMAEHELPSLYVRNGAVYATRTDVISRGQLLGEDCRAYVMPSGRSIDINEEIDLAFAEFLLARQTLDE